MTTLVDQQPHGMKGKKNALKGEKAMGAMISFRCHKKHKYAFESQAAAENMKLPAWITKTCLESIK